MQSLSSTVQSPYIQGIVVVILSLITILIFKNKNYETIIYAGAFWLYIFMIINPLVGIVQTDFWSYILKSIFVFIVCFFVIPMLIEMFKKYFNSQGSGEAMAIFMFIIFYPVIILVAWLLRWLIR